MKRVIEALLIFAAIIIIGDSLGEILAAIWCVGFALALEFLT